MSWDLIIFADDPRPLNDETKLVPLGEANEVRTKISRSLPEVDWSDPAWGSLSGNGWSIEFNHETNGITDTIMLHVRGTGDPLPAIVKLCRDNEWVVYDLGLNDLIDLATPSSNSWGGFQSYRDQIVARSEQATSQPRPVLQFSVATTMIGLLLVVFLIAYGLRRRA